MSVKGGPRGAQSKACIQEDGIADCVRQKRISYSHLLEDSHEGHAILTSGQGRAWKPPNQIYRENRHLFFVDMPGNVLGLRDVMS